MAHPPPFSPNAVAVHMAGGHVGYVPRRIAAMLQPVLTSAAASCGGRLNGYPARIVTGHGSPQIVLMLDVAQFGIDRAALP